MTLYQLYAILLTNPLIYVILQYQHKADYLMTKELLPVTITPDTHPYLIRLSQCYRPHTPIPSRQELLENQYEQSHHMSIRGLTQQVGIDYDKFIKSKR